MLDTHYMRLSSETKSIKIVEAKQGHTDGLQRFIQEANAQIDKRDIGTTTCTTNKRRRKPKRSRKSTMMGK